MKKLKKNKGITYTKKEKATLKQRKENIREYYRKYMQEVEENIDNAGTVELDFLVKLSYDTLSEYQASLTKLLSLRSIDNEDTLKEYSLSISKVLSFPSLLKGIRNQYINELDSLKGLLVEDNNYEPEKDEMRIADDIQSYIETIQKRFLNNIRFYINSIFDDIDNELAEHFLKHTDSQIKNDLILLNTHLDSIEKKGELYEINLKISDDKIDFSFVSGIKSTSKAVVFDIKYKKNLQVSEFTTKAELENLINSEYNKFRTKGEYSNSIEITNFELKENSNNSKVKQFEIINNNGTLKINTDKSNHKDLSVKDLNKLANKNGFYLDHCTGDHGVFKKKNSSKVIIIPQSGPIHNGLQHKILKDMQSIV